MKNQSAVLKQEKSEGKDKKIGIKNTSFQGVYALIALVVLCVLLTFLSPDFLTVNNIISIALQTAVIAIIAIGMTYVIITSGIDLSVGSVIALAGVVAAQLLTNGVNIVLAMLFGVIIGALFGLLNGLLITKGNLQPFIATLGTMMIARGLSLVLTDGLPVSGLPKSFTTLGNGRLLGIPIPVIFLIVIAIIAHFVLSKTVFGRYVYALGSNEEAARLSGVNTNLNKIYVYILSGVLAAIAGMILAARLVSAQPSAGTGYEMDAIASVVIGGASMAGGIGSITGTVIGAFTIGVLRNGLNLLNVSPFWQQIAIGIVILLAVYFDHKKNKK